MTETSLRKCTFPFTSLLQPYILRNLGSCFCVLLLLLLPSFFVFDDFDDDISLSLSLWIFEKPNFY